MSRDPIEIQIFAIDDDKSMTDLIGHILTIGGYENYKLFNNPDDLLAELNENVHICIVDYMLHDEMNGLELIKKVVKINRHCWFIMLSGQDDYHVIIDYLNSVYGSRYIEKANPDKSLIDELLGHINDIVEQINFIDDFYFNARRIHQSFNDLKTLLAT